MYEPIRLNKEGHLPPQFDVAHDLCFVLHDLMAQLIVDGMRAGLFHARFDLKSDDERVSLEESESVLDWLHQTGRVEERTKVLVSMVFPAVLSDMMHCIYEALECSRKGKLALVFMLIRKPLQESLYVLESIFVDRLGFSGKLSDDPLKLRPQNAGGIDGHAQRIQAVLDKISDGIRFSAEYIARLRYDKKSDDSFDGVCNKAMHLFTEHSAIRTEKLNVNFIFSDNEAMISQWSYLYGRLPYLMLYMLSLVEHIATEFASSSPSYRDDIDRRISAYLIMTWAAMEERYRSPPINIAAALSSEWLKAHCADNGYSHPNGYAHFDRMAKTGAFPEESEEDVKLRSSIYEQIATYSRDRPSSAQLFERYDAGENIPSGVMPHAVVSRMVDGTPPLKAWREHLGLTQEEMRVQMGVSRSTYQRYERLQRLTLAVRESAAVVMGINAAFLDP